MNLHQVFRIWILPFYAAHVSLTSVLHLTKVPASVYSSRNPRFFIKAQNDLYQVNEFVKFVSWFGVLGVLVMVGQFVATGLCVLRGRVGRLVGWSRGLLGGIGRGA